MSAPTDPNLSVPDIVAVSHSSTESRQSSAASGETMPERRNEEHAILIEELTLLNEQLRMKSATLSFQIAPDGDSFMVRVVDHETLQTIKQFKHEELKHLQVVLTDFIEQSQKDRNLLRGLLFDQVT